MRSKQYGAIYFIAGITAAVLILLWWFFLQASIENQVNSQLSNTRLNTGEVKFVTYQEYNVPKPESVKATQQVSSCIKQIQKATSLPTVYCKCPDNTGCWYADQPDWEDKFNDWDCTYRRHSDHDSYYDDCEENCKDDCQHDCKDDCKEECEDESDNHCEEDCRDDCEDNCYDDCRDDCDD